MCPPAEPQALRVYSRPGCHLCEILVEELLPLVRERMRVEIVDISEDDDLEAQYGTRIPVLEFGGRLICQYHLDRQAIADLLASHAPSPP